MIWAITVWNPFRIAQCVLSLLSLISSNKAHLWNKREQKYDPKSQKGFLLEWRFHLFSPLKPVTRLCVWQPGLRGCPTHSFPELSHLLKTLSGCGSRNYKSRLKRCTTGPYHWPLQLLLRSPSWKWHCKYIRDKNWALHPPSAIVGCEEQLVDLHKLVYSRGRQVHFSSSA